MKTKITILLIALFVLAFSAQALAQTKDVALIYGAETQTTDVAEPVWAETVLVQLNANLVDPSFSWTPAEWALILGDFKILDGANLVPVTAAEVSAVDTNYISLSFDFSTYHFGPDKNDLKLHYLNYSGIAITTDYGNLQNTSTAVNIDDGIAPILYNYTITSSNANEFLGESGDVVTFYFEADEALAMPPDAPPEVTFTVPEMKYSIIVEAATTDPLQKAWTATFTIPSPGDNLDGLVSVSATFWDVHANSGSLSPAVDVGTDGSFVTVKNYDPTYTYVGASFDATTLPTPYMGDTDDQIYLWNVFNTIDECVDAVVVDGYVIVCSDITEDPTIGKGVSIISKDLPAKAGYTVYGDFDVTADDVLFSNLIFDPDAIAVTLNSSAGALDNFAFLDCTFDLTVGGAIGIHIGGYTTPTAVSYIYMRNNVFNGPTNKISNPWKIGGSYGSPVYCDVSMLYFGFNEVNRGSIPINFGSNNLFDFEFQDNIFANTDGIVYVWDSAPKKDPVSTFENFWFYDNDLSTGNTYGIGVGGPGVGNPNYTTTQFTNFLIEDNDFSNIAGDYGFGAVSFYANAPTKAIPAPTVIADATNNWWGDETGPANATYNPQGLGSGVTDNVWFSHWYTDAGMTTLGSSQIAIQGAMDGSTVAINNVVSNTDGTISMLVAMDYPTFDINLPEELFTDALVESDIAFNDEAYVVIEGWSQSWNVDLDGTKSWLSVLVSSPRLPLYLQADFNISLTFHDLDDAVRELTFTQISARTGDFDFLNTYEDITADCVYNNDYRGIENGDSGYELAKATTTLQDPMQIALGTTLDITNLACNTDAMLSFDVDIVYPTFPATPTLSSDWLTDGYIDSPNPFTAWVDSKVINNVTATLYYDGTPVGQSNITGKSSFWLSEEFSLTRQPLLGHSGLTVKWTIEITGADESLYNDVAVYSVAAADGNFTDPTTPPKVSQDQYILAQDSQDFQDPIRYAQNGTSVDIVDATLANTINGTIEFEVDVDYPTWTDIPELPELLLVDAKIEADLDKGIPAGVIIDVYYGGLSGTQVAHYTTAGENYWWLSDLILNYDPSALVRPPLKNDFDHTWGVQISNLDAAVHNVTISSIASDFIKKGYFVLGSDNITIQDPIEVVIAGITTDLNDLISTTDDKIEFDVDVDYPVFSTTPDMSADWLVDVFIKSDKMFVGADDAEYALTPKVYNHPQGSSLMEPTIQADLGANYDLAEWTDLKAKFASSAEIDTWAGELGLINHGIYWIKFNGSEIYSGTRHYYIQYSTDGPTIGLVHDSYLSRLYVGSWYESHQALVRDTNFDPKLLSEVLVDIYYNSTLVKEDYNIAGTHGGWLSDMLGSAPTALIGHDNLSIEWGLVITGLNSTEYNIDFYTVTAADGNFVDPTSSKTSQTQYELDQLEQTIQDPIQFAIDNTTLAISAITPPTAKGALEFTMTVDYPVFPSNPVLPVEPGQNILNVDCLIEANISLPATTNIELSYNGTLLGDTTLGVPTDEIWLSEIITAINPALPIRTPLVGHSDLTDEWLVVLTGLDYYAYELDFTTVASDNFVPSKADPGYYELATQTADFTIPVVLSLQLRYTDDGIHWTVLDCDPPPTVYNEGTFTLTSDPMVNTYQMDVAAMTTNTPLKDGLNAFYLTGAPANKTYPNHGLRGVPVTYTFLDYWADKGVTAASTGLNSWIWSAINGTSPYFYIKVATIPGKGTTYSTIDGPNYDYDATEQYHAYDGSLFTGTYTLTGTLLGENGLISDLNTLNIVQLPSLTVPEFTTLDLQDRVQPTKSTDWIDLSFTAGAYVMYLNDLIANYDMNLNTTTAANYELAAGYYGFVHDYTYLSVDEQIAFFNYWNAKGVNVSATPGTWQAQMWEIINGNAPTFYVKVSQDGAKARTYSLVDGLMKDYFLTEQYLQVPGDYPLAEYKYDGVFMGVNGTHSENLEVHINFQEALAQNFVVTVDPVSPFVDSFFDIFVDAVDVNGEIVDTSTTVFFSSNYAGSTQLPSLLHLLNGELDVINGGMCSEIVTDLQITVSEFNPFTLTGMSDDIEILAKNAPAAPTSVVFTDLPNDNGGWVVLDYTLSVDDPFYTAVKDPSYGVSYYVVEIFMPSVSGGQWDFLANISCYDNGSGTNDYTALLPAPASDTPYAFRMASVYNPTKLGGFDENHISYTEIVTKDAGAQSAWQTGSAAPKDNLPAYANMKIFLQGPYQPGGIMTDGADKPLTSPYDGETIAALPLPNDQIVDWIYVQLRDTATGSTVKEANAFLLIDGTIVDVDGNQSLPFYYTTDIEYYFVILHRNHLAMMGSTTHKFGDFASQATTIDLTTIGTAYNDGFIEVETGVFALYDGDANHSEFVNVNDAYDLINNFGATGYLGSDLNLSGYVNVNDAYELIGNFGVGTSVPGAKLGETNNGQQVEFNIPSTDAKVIECTLEMKNFVVVAGVSYSFDVYITRNTSNWSALGHLLFVTETYYSELVFNYNGSALNNPVVSGLNPVATNTVVTTPSPGKLSINLIDGGITVPMTETKLLTVTFDVTDPAATSQLSWNNVDTGIINQASVQYSTAGSTLSSLGSDDSTLPVELSSFAALYSALDENIKLKWDTATENDVNGFNIYRSEIKDLTRAGRHINYSLITAAGTTTEPQSYIYGDVVGDVYAIHYYWLEVVDFGGTSTFHGPYGYTPGDIDGDSTPDLIASTELLGNFPNPAINSTQIKYQLKGTVIDQNATISVYNVRGEFVKTLEGRNGVATLDTSDMGHGIYFYRLQTDDYSDIKKLIVVK